MSFDITLDTLRQGLESQNKAERMRVLTRLILATSDTTPGTSHSNSIISSPTTSSGDKKLSPYISAGLIPLVIKQTAADRTMQERGLGFSALANLSFGQENGVALVEAGVIEEAVSFLRTTDPVTLDLTPADLQTQNDVYTNRAYESIVECLSALSDNPLNTIPLEEAGVVPILLNIVGYTKPGEARKDAVRCLLHLAENAILRDNVLKELRAFPLPFSNLTDRIQTNPTNVDEKLLLLDFYRCLDIIKDYVKPGKVFYNATDFPWIKTLEQMYPTIKREFLKLDLAKNLVDWPEKYCTISIHLCQKGWEVFGLFAFGNKLEDNCAQVPETTKALQSIPGMTTAMFSCLRPRSHIRPHIGYYQYSNRILRCHLGISIPTDGETGLKVNGVVQTWKDGECFVFDDTFRHEAYNMSRTTLRVVLMIDFVCKVDDSLRNPDFLFNSPSSEVNMDDAIVSAEILEALGSFATTHNMQITKPLEKPVL